MTSLSDTLTVGLVLVLLFGSIALYLYTRIQQTEQKISLLETILLDLKMSAEIKSYSELPATELSEMKGGNQSESNAEYRPFDDIFSLLPSEQTYEFHHGQNASFPLDAFEFFE